MSTVLTPASVACYMISSEFCRQHWKAHAMQVMSITWVPLEYRINAISVIIPVRHQTKLGSSADYQEIPQIDGYFGFGFRRRD